MYRLQLQYNGEWVTMQEFDSREKATKSKFPRRGHKVRIQKKGGDGQWKTC